MTEKCTASSPVAALPLDIAYGPTTEKHYSAVELAKLWSLSPSKIRRIFENEPGVLRIGTPSGRTGRKLKRSYFTMRIPVSVAERIHRRLGARPKLTIN